MHCLPPGSVGHYITIPRRGKFYSALLSGGMSKA